MRVFDEAATQAALPFDILIDRLRTMFCTGCEVPARHSHAIETASSGGTLLIMPAWNSRYLGIKTVNVFPGNLSRNLPGLHSTYTLFDATSGVPVAQMDGNVITSRRTAAASALAASFLARDGASRLTVVGAGRVGGLLALAHSVVLSLDHVEVWDRDHSKAECVAEALKAEGLSAVASVDVERSVRTADIVSTATFATEPIVIGAWMVEGSHLDLVGSFRPDMREADDTSFAGRSVFVDTPEAVRKSGELLHAFKSGVMDERDVLGTLEALCRRTTRGRTSSTERTVFKSVGSALEDLAAAIQVYES